MKRILFLLFTVHCSLITLVAQAPQGFNYQAVIRDDAQNIVSEQAVGIRISILQGAVDGTVVYSETHSTTTNAYGLVTLEIGEGTIITGDLSTIDWGGDIYFLRVEMDPGTGYQEMGTTQLLSVPYALFADKTADKDDADADPANEIQDLSLTGNILTITGNLSPTDIDLSTYLDNTDSWVQNGEAIFFNGDIGIGTDSPGGKLEVVGDGSEAPDDPLFEVKRNDGQTVFAVYPEGVRIYVEEESAKGTKGGFAIGGFSPAKGLTNEFLRVTPDSIRMYVNDDGLKGTKGGFAIGGFSPVKGYTNEYLRVSPDSVRVYVEGETGKGTKGGFAIGGIRPIKGIDEEYLRVTTDSVRVYINDNPLTKGTKGGFAIGGFSPLKGLTGDYLNVSGKAEAEIIDPSDARILWYPNKEAFLTGKILIESPDSVGINSMATGFESKAIGDYSQALGYQAIARKDYSTAIGYQAVANDINSFAFGQWANAKNEESYAFGRGAIAEGFRSFAFGSSGIDSAGVETGVAHALGDYSFAIGQGSITGGFGSFTLGLADTASGQYSIAMGYKTNASGDYSTAIGWYANASEKWSTAMGPVSTASGIGSTAIGWKTIASGNHSNAMGQISTASGYGSIAMGAGCTAVGNYSVATGYFSIANSCNCFVIGKHNDTLTNSNRIHWVDTDPLFIIGNGYNYLNRHNAVTVLKNGNVGIGTITPQGTLDVNGSIYQRGSELHADYVFENEYDLESIEDHSSYMWQNKHLPAIPKATKDENGNDIVEWGARSRGVLEELEKAHVYIDQLNTALKEQQTMIEELKQEIEKLKNQ